MQTEGLLVQKGYRVLVMLRQIQTAYSTENSTYSL